MVRLIYADVIEGVQHGDRASFTQHHRLARPACNSGVETSCEWCRGAGIVPQGAMIHEVERKALADIFGCRGRRAWPPGPKIRENSERRALRTRGKVHPNEWEKIGPEKRRHVYADTELSRRGNTGSCRRPALLFPLPACWWVPGFPGRVCVSRVVLFPRLFPLFLSRFLFRGASSLCGYRPKDR